MSDGVLGVSADELARVSRLLAATAAGLSSELSALDAEVSALMGPLWNGGSASAFAEQWFRFAEGAKLVNQGLSQMSSLLVSNKDAFVNQESANEAETNAVGDRL